LFYEAETANLYQNSKGWFITGDTLKHFFETNLFACGFNQKEITDFTDYWIPLLDPKLDYLIYPQFNEEIDPIITLEFSAEPDCILRLFYVIEKYQGYPAELEEPVIHKFERIGFIVTEWGVILRGNGL
jgi:hypothetical protein